MAKQTLTSGLRADKGRELLALDVQHRTECYLHLLDDMYVRPWIARAYALIHGQVFPIPGSPDSRPNDRSPVPVIVWGITTVLGDIEAIELGR